MHLLEQDDNHTPYMTCGIATVETV